MVLHDAACRGDLEALKSIISENHDIINTQNDKGETALYCAIENGHQMVAKFLVEVCGADVGIVCTHGTIALHAAILRGGNLETVQLLTTNDTLNVLSQRMGQSPINLAARFGHESFVNFLLDQGADFTLPNFAGETPLFSAARSGHLSIVTCLVEKIDSTAIDQTDAFGASPFFVACMCGHLSVAEYMSSKGADVTKTKNDDMSPLIVAAWRGHLDIVQYLVKEKGCDPKESTVFGRVGSKVIMSNQQDTAGTFAQVPRCYSLFRTIFTVFHCCSSFCCPLPPPSRALLLLPMDMIHVNRNRHLMCFWTVDTW